MGGFNRTSTLVILLVFAAFFISVALSVGAPSLFILFAILVVILGLAKVLRGR